MSDGGREDGNHHAAPHDPAIRIAVLSGDALARGIPHVARLRMAVFRAWPYLYDGDLAYEEDYLANFARGSGSIIVAASAGDRIIGAATGSPLSQHTSEFAPLFTSFGYDPAAVFYCGESVLLPEYRGRGIGHAFFDHREAHARQLRDAGAYAFKTTAFCGVVRPDDHPACPPDHRPLDPFWQKRGYQKIEGMVGSYGWKDLGETGETSKPMQFWVRPLD